MSALFHPEKRRPGRKRTVTARAWISRKEIQGAFYSHVSLGQGRTFTIATDTRDRNVALRFNQAHLLSCFKQHAPAAAPATEVQHEFPIFAHSA